MTATRVERDSLGPVNVPAGKLWGAQTQRSLEHLSIGESRIPREMTPAYAIVKKAASLVKFDFGPLQAAHAAGATACSRASRRRGGILAKASLCAGVAKTHWSHSQRRTAVMASKNITWSLPAEASTARFIQRAVNTESV